MFIPAMKGGISGDFFLKQIAFWKIKPSARLVVEATSLKKIMHTSNRITSPKFRVKYLQRSLSFHHLDLKKQYHTWPWLDLFQFFWRENSLISIFNSYHLPRNKITLSKTNSSQLNIGRNPKENIIWTSHPFSGANSLLVSTEGTKKSIQNRRAFGSLRHQSWVFFPQKTRIKITSKHLQVSIFLKGLTSGWGLG